MSCSENNINFAVNPHTLGLILLNANQIEDKTHQIVKTPVDDNHPLEFAVGLINSLLLKFEKDNLEKRESRERTIQIDRLGVSVGDFGIDEKTKQALIESGKQAVKDYFAAIRNAKLANEIIPFACKKVAVGRMWSKPSANQNIFPDEGLKPKQPENENSKKSAMCMIV
jgi:hypothetical protein